LTGDKSRTKTHDADGDETTISDGSSRYSYLYDPGDSVSLLLDQSGNVKESYGYSACGNANASISKKASGFSTGRVPTNPVRFQGKRFDSGSGSYDMGTRRYSPSVGRWLQQDMYYGALDNLGLSQDPLTANRYAFLGAKPVNYVEFDGHRVAWDGASARMGVHTGLPVRQTTAADVKRLEKQSGRYHLFTLSHLSMTLSVASTVAYGACAFRRRSAAE
jgi:RHS repeat-associated protein